MRSESGSPVGEFEAKRRTNLANSGTLRSSLTASGLHKPLLLLRAVRVLPRMLDIPGFHSARLKIFKLLNHFVAFPPQCICGRICQCRTPSRLRATLMSGKQGHPSQKHWL